MGAIDDIMSVMRWGPKKIQELSPLKMNTKSVVGGANDATFQFSCLVSDATPTDYADTLTGFCDRKYAAMTQTWISLHPFMDITLDPTPITYLRRLHQNMRFESTEDDLPDFVTENCYNGERVVYKNYDDTVRLILQGTDKVSNKVISENKDNLLDYLSDYNLNGITTYEDDEEDYSNANAYDVAQAMVAGKSSMMQHKRRIDNLKSMEKFTQAPKLVERDLKRANNMLPFGIEVRLIAKNEKNEFVQYIDFILGVKTILHLIKSDECIDNIIRTLQNKSPMFRFIRWKTGEISLMKNLILDLDNIKLDVADREFRRNPYFSSLRRLKNKRLRMNNLTSPYLINPNSTFVITSYEVDYILNNYGIDIQEIRTAKKLKEGLFLMSFIIIDEGSGVINVLDDGIDTFQTYALETLERENSLSSNKLGREIGRMISH